MHIDLQPAYIIHTRPFQNSSLLVDMLTEDFGRVSAVAKGSRRPKSRQRNLLQPFIPVLVSWKGKHHLKTLVDIEAQGRASSLTGRYLYGGFYSNELLNYLLVSGLAMPAVYELYQMLLTCLSQQSALEVCLRRFEFSLLMELGYGIDFFNEALSHHPIQADLFYRFDVDTGFIALAQTHALIRGVYLGKILLAIGQGNYTDKSVRQAAKQIARTAIEPHLQGRALKSRELFTTLK
ncbi:MAG: DNA repair protein RecO [Cellvibrionaceae bacterium]|nr:DNA repair protein RecO [Cellvibrionaceae bacterium]